MNQSRIGYSSRAKSPSVLDEIWSLISHGLSELFNGHKFDITRYMMLNSLVYSYCCQMDACMSRVRIESSLYSRLGDLIEIIVDGILKECLQKPDNDLIEYYIQRWTTFRQCLKKLDGVFGYVNNHWIRQTIRDQRDTNVYYVSKLCLNKWRQVLLEGIDEKFHTLIAKIVRDERDGRALNRSLYTMLIDSLVEFGVDDQNGMLQHQLTRRYPQLNNNNHHNENNNGPPESADEMEQRIERETREKFSDRYIDEAEAYFLAEAEHLKNVPFTEYLKKIEERLYEENSRCDFYLTPTSYEKIAKVLEKNYILKHKECFAMNFEKLLENGMEEHLSRMYQICGVLPTSMMMLKQFGQKLLSQIGAKQVKDPREFMLDIFNGFGFKIIKAHNEASASCYSRAHGSNENQSPILATMTARYCDFLLRKSTSQLEEAELQARLQDTLTVFNYLDDKDIFRQIYGKLMAKRLLTDTLIAENVERWMITQLREISGFEYTKRFDEMVNDAQNSKELTVEFEKKCQNQRLKMDFDFSAIVVNELAWPTMSKLQIQIPSQLLTPLNHFTDFYKQLHNGRKLTWIHSQSRGELVTNGFKKQYTITAYTPQIAVLILYNASASFSLEQMMNELGCSKDHLIPIVDSLLKIGLIRSNDIEIKEELSLVTSGSISFVINENFQSKKLKIDLTRIQGKIERRSDGDKKEIDDNRRLQIEACITRIMKIRASLSHSQLLDEVVSQLSPRFSPSLPRIRSSIETLIERGFLKRSDHSINVYEYMV